MSKCFMIIINMHNAEHTSAQHVPTIPFCAYLSANFDSQNRQFF